MTNQEQPFYNLLTDQLTSRCETDLDVHMIDYKRYKDGFRLEDADGFHGNMTVFVSKGVIERRGLTLDTFEQFLKSKGAGKIKPRKRDHSYSIYD